MKPIGMHLSWISVSNLSNAIEFYTDSVGLELKEHNKEQGWAELSGKEGARLGLYQAPTIDEAGTNAVVTINVENIEEAVADLKAKQVTLIDDIVVIEGVIMMQMFEDADGNLFQVCQLLKNIKK